jgi:hypothetical protein
MCEPCPYQSLTLSARPPWCSARPWGAAVPAFWPAVGFDRGDLFDLPNAAIDALLVGYGLPAGAAVGGVPARRNDLARHIGTEEA